jgi:hypothetical protein
MGACARGATCGSGVRSRSRAMHRLRRPSPYIALARSPRSDHIALVAPQACGLGIAFVHVEYVDE